MTTPKLAIKCLVSTNVCWETSQEVWLQVVGVPCWLGTLPSVLLGVRNRWIFTSNIPNCLTWYQKALVKRCCCFQVFSQNFPLGAPGCAHKTKPCFVTLRTFFRSTAGQVCQNTKLLADYPARVLLVESLRSFLDKSGKRKEEAEKS